MKKFIKDLKDDFQNKQYGELVHKVTSATGIKKVVDTVSDLTGRDCGCDARRERWNVKKDTNTTNTTQW